VSVFRIPRLSSLRNESARFQAFKRSVEGTHCVEMLIGIEKVTSWREGVENAL
jgi:hypothetical protein